MGRKKVAIVTSGYFPVPPVRGGAIETLVNILYKENEIEGSLDLTVYSIYDMGAERQSCQSEGNRIEYIKIPWAIETLDYVSYFIFKNILRKKKHMSYRYIFQRLYYISEVSKKLSKNEFDRIVFENHPTLLRVLKKKENCKRYRGKYFYHAHNEILNTFDYDRFLNKAKGFICVSDFVSRRIHELLPNYPVGNIKVLRNRVDEVKFRNLDQDRLRSFRKKYHIPEGFFLFVFIGRLNPEKGVKELLEAYKQAHPINSKLVIAGSYYFGSGIRSEYENELKKLAEEIKDEIVFTGYIEYDDMPYMYAVSDVVVLPSIWNDPAPLTVIESLTCGKPLITTDSGGIPEYANENNSVILHINDGLVENLKKAINVLADDLKERTELIEKAKEESRNWKKADYYKEFIHLLD